MGMRRVVLRERGSVDSDVHCGDDEDGEVESVSALCMTR